MRYILQNANIFATNLKYMNDSEEYVNGVKELSKIINAQKSECVITEEMVQKYYGKTSDSYSISFSTERDLLSQWSMYAKESGVSLRMEFDSKQTYIIKEKDGGNEDDKKIECLGLKPKKVYYCTENTMSKSSYQKVKERIEKQLLDVKKNKLALKDMESNVKEIWEENIPYIKRYEFKAEEEYRLVFRQEEWIQEFKVEYRLDKNVLKPYVDVVCRGGWPIRELIIGPGFNQLQVFESVCHFLQNAELNVPVLSNLQFQERCEEYIKEYVNSDKDVKEVWDKNKHYLSGEKTDRYKQWLDIKDEMARRGSDELKNI